MSVVNGHRLNVRSSDASVGVVRSGDDFDLSVAVDLGPIDTRLDALEAAVVGLSDDVVTLGDNIDTVQGNLDDLQAAFNAALGPPEVFDVETDDDATQTVVITTLPVVGAACFWYLSLRGDQDNSERGMRFNYWADASRNAAGVGAVVQGTIGPTGFTDVPPSPPWNTSGAAPAGWAASAIDIAGDDVRFQFNGAVGQTVRWRIVVQRILIGGAT